MLDFKNYTYIERLYSIIQYQQVKKMGKKKH